MLVEMSVEKFDELLEIFEIRDFDKDDPKYMSLKREVEAWFRSMEWD